MTRQALSILIADDDEGDRRQLRRALKQVGPDYKVTEVRDIQEMVLACGEHEFDCAFLDYRMPFQDGLEGISLIRETSPQTAVVMVTGQGDETVASEAIKRGAADYLPKRDIEATVVRRVIDDALEKAELRRKVVQHRQELENFAAVLVHDLKSPIRSIMYLSSAIEESMKDGDLDAVVEDCQNVVRSVETMERLIDTLHTYTKVEQQVQFETVDVNNVMQDLTQQLAVTIQERGAKVTWDLLPRVYASASLLLQLLQNLVANGIKFCTNNTPEIHVSAQQVGDVWQFSVRDNGIGIAKKNRKKIFEAFSRLHLVTEYEGTGLGLATCAKIVEKHHGSIWCESELGKGTTFLFTI